jgi:hypothetical protein
MSEDLSETSENSNTQLGGSKYVFSETSISNKQTGGGAETENGIGCEFGETSDNDTQIGGNLFSETSVSDKQTGGGDDEYNTQIGSGSKRNNKYTTSNDYSKNPFTDEQCLNSIKNFFKI